MPAFEKRDLKQDILYFPCSSIIGVAGQKSVTSAWQHIKGRWNDVEKEALAPDGTTVRIDAEVVLDFAAVIGDVVWLGKPEDLPGTSNAAVPVSNLMQIKTVNNTPDIKNRNNRHTFGLIKWSDSLPTV